ncbi:MAG: hypothetical protein ACXAC8_04135 [Candidatus Hodarchaeales archaeon]|jgi:hypothetical protein
MKDQSLKERLIQEFPGKVENERAFIMQFVVNEALNGRKVPPKEEIEKTINEMSKDGTFEKKGELLILKIKRPILLPELEEEPDIQNTLTELNNGGYTEIQQKILSVFEGKYENREAIVMNATVQALSQGKTPPKKDELEKSIDELIEKGTLELKGNILIKKI